MLERLYTPTVAIDDEVVVRRSGLFYREKIRLSDIQRVVAVVKDAATHEEIAVGFFDEVRDRVWLSEFDKNFVVVMDRLTEILPGFVFPKGLSGQEPFEKAQKILWEKS